MNTDDNFDLFGCFWTPYLWSGDAIITVLPAERKEKER